MSRFALARCPICQQTKPHSVTIYPHKQRLFIGRQNRDIAALKTLLGDPSTRLISILGPGGMGKTRLALEVIRGQIAHFSDGVFFVPLGSVQAIDHLHLSIGEAIGYAFQDDGRSSKRQFEMTILRQKQMLLLLDNLEHLLDGVQRITDILQQAPNVRILATSRERLRLSSETTFALSGLYIAS